MTEPIKYDHERGGQVEPEVAVRSPLPEPRLRDQLAEVLLLGSGGRQYWDPEELRDIVNDIEAFVAAELGRRGYTVTPPGVRPAEAAVKRVEHLYAVLVEGGALFATLPDLRHALDDTL